MNRLLKNILYKVSLKSVSGITDLEINGIFFDSRLVGKGSIFIATIGTQSDGHQFIDKAIEKGAIAIVCQLMPGVLKHGITYIQVTDSTVALGIMASNYYSNPSAQLKLVGVTGTNGKTTTVTLLHKLFVQLGYRVGMLSTVENKINEEVLPSTHTTPDAVSLNHYLYQMLESGCTHCFMEVSSHAIVQHRISGLTFKGAIFTNISHDHLDYHKTFSEYIKAKKGFFDVLGAEAFSLVNSDDKNGSIMVQNSKARKYTFSLKSMSDFKAKIISDSFSGLEMDIDNQQVWFKLVGSFNAYNLMGVYGTSILLGEEREEVLTQLSNLDSAKGRFEKIISTTGIIVIVDYAHTPDALENVLQTINESKLGKEELITVIGCGGNRDVEKRPIMAAIAVKHSNRIILTSDNPRDEEPQSILEQMEKGISITNKKKALSILDRREAIKTACVLANSGDIILIAGKGHENYQEIKGVKHPFDDKEVVLNILELLGK